ncbi:MAG: hypothetical protein ACYC0V_00615 [Armatimonadota bacterium]
MSENYEHPDEIDPCLGEKSLLEEIQELFDIERIRMRKVCLECSRPGAPVFMDEFVGTMAEIHDDAGEDNVFIRTWAQCPMCNRVICLT